MDRYLELVELAQICARNAHLATSDDVAHALWRMATEYHAQAAALGAEPNIGGPPVRIVGSGTGSHTNQATSRSK
jgi:hypothetical protein